MLSNKSAQVRV